MIINYSEFIKFNTIKINMESNKNYNTYLQNRHVLEECINHNIINGNSYFACKNINLEFYEFYKFLENDLHNAGYNNIKVDINKYNDISIILDK